MITVSHSLGLKKAVVRGPTMDVGYVGRAVEEEVRRVDVIVVFLIEGLIWVLRHYCEGGGFMG